jgi:hypothetical protein
MGWGGKGNDGASANSGAAPNTVSDAKNAKLVKGIEKIDPDERERLADVAAETYGAFRRNGGSD